MGAYTGGAAPADVLRLRRMTAEVGSATYTDAELIAAIERYPVADENGYEPIDYDWVATYDLARAASEIWSEKSAAIASNFAFDADGASFQKQQQYEHFTQQARLWNGRRVAGVWTVETVIDTGNSGIVGNWNDPYE